VNYLGHFLLTNQLMPLLRAAPAPRVVSVASVASYLPTARIQLDDLQRASPLSYGRPCTLRHAPRTLHPAPCTLHPAPCTLHPTPRAPRPTQLHHAGRLLRVPPE
jgi:NAD(P)-dependent dehydrogenase (short-subunit alcohol dehydrogenase family)